MVEIKNTLISTKIIGLYFNMIGLIIVSIKIVTLLRKHIGEQC